MSSNNHVTRQISQMLTSTDAAQYLGISRRTLENSRCSGVLCSVPCPKFRKMGKSVRYSREALDEWLSQFKALRKSLWTSSTI